MRYSLAIISYWLLSLCSFTYAYTTNTYTDPVTAYDFTGLTVGMVPDGAFDFAFFKAPQTGLYTFTAPYAAEISIGYGYDFLDGYSWTPVNPYVGLQYQLEIFLIEGFYYALAGETSGLIELTEFKVNSDSYSIVLNYIYKVPSSTYPTTDYNINYITESYLMGTTITSGSVSTTITGPFTTQFLDATTPTTLEAIFTVVPLPVETSYDTSSSVYTTDTVSEGITKTYIVDVVPYSTITFYSNHATTLVTETIISGVSTTVVLDVIATSASSSSSTILSSTPTTESFVVSKTSSSSVSSIISSVQGSVFSSTSVSTIPIQTYIWTADYTSTITMTVADGYISVPSGGLFKRDVAYETAVLIPTPTSINWADVSGNTEVVEYVELYENGQTSAIDVTYTRPVSSAGFGSSSTSTTTITTRSTVTSTQTSTSTVTKYATLSSLVTSASGSIATTRTTTATLPGNLTSSYTDVVTTTNSLGQTIIFTEVVVVCPESTASSVSSTYTGVVSTVNDVGETIVATDIVVYCPESTRSTIGSVSATSSSVVTSVNSTETLVYTEVVVYCPEFTRTTTGSVSSTSTGHATTTNAEGATITYTDVVIYCPESGVASESKPANGTVVASSSMITSATKETSISSKGYNSEQSTTSTTLGSNVTVEEYQGGATNLGSYFVGSIAGLFLMLLV